MSSTNSIQNFYMFTKSFTIIYITSLHPLQTNFIAIISLVLNNSKPTSILRTKYAKVAFHLKFNVAADTLLNIFVALSVQPTV